MKELLSPGWSWYVAILTVVSLLVCLWVLRSNSVKKEHNAGDPKLHGHNEWDGLREYDNPLPRWWVGLFILTVIFAVGYLYAYPGLGTREGTLSWSSKGQYESEVAKANKELEPLYARFASMTPEAIAVDTQAKAIGERLFMNNCAQCHGSDARGSKGFPNLADGDWLYGGTHDKILETLQKGRIGNMPPMAAAVGSPEDVRNLSHYVLSLSGSPHDSLRASLGKSKFGACAACHGMDGKGNQALGAPNLTDDIWLHGWGEAAITAMINNGKVNQMPAQADKLTEAQIKVLASYVWGLSNNKAQ